MHGLGKLEKTKQRDVPVKTNSGLEMLSSVRRRYHGWLAYEPKKAFEFYKKYPDVVRQIEKPKPKFSHRISQRKKSEWGTHNMIAAHWDLVLAIQRKLRVNFRVSVRELALETGRHPKTLIPILKKLHKLHLIFYVPKHGVTHISINTDAHFGRQWERVNLLYIFLVTPSVEVSFRNNSSGMKTINNLSSLFPKIPSSNTPKKLNKKSAHSHQENPFRFFLENIEINSLYFIKGQGIQGYNSLQLSPLGLSALLTIRINEMTRSPLKTTANDTNVSPQLLPLLPYSLTIIASDDQILKSAKIKDAQYLLQLRSNKKTHKDFYNRIITDIDYQTLYAEVRLGGNSAQTVPEAQKILEAVEYYATVRENYLIGMLYGTKRPSIASRNRIRNVLLPTVWQRGKTHYMDTHYEFSGMLHYDALNYAIKLWRGRSYSHINRLINSKGSVRINGYVPGTPRALPTFLKLYKHQRKLIWKQYTSSNDGDYKFWRKKNMNFLENIPQKEIDEKEYYKVTADMAMMGPWQS